MRGLRGAWRHESAFRQEVCASLLVLPLAVWLGEDAVQVVLLGASWLLVLITELLNTAVEAVVDRVGEEPHHLAGMAKDVGSAAVFMSLVLATFVWGVLLWARFA
ncbi:diacylglycerol kinase [Arhodomonas sp. AD133]|uniref:diacylglycerol kinase n=1 Tax=Arhodomonas sp. AD133 TaxID=3415009 RepID=UPI003EB9315D